MPKSQEEIRRDAQAYGLTDAEQQAVWVAEGKRRERVALTAADEGILRRAGERERAFPEEFGPRRGVTGRDVPAVPVPASFEEAERRYVAAVQQERVIAEDPKGPYLPTDEREEAQRDRNFRRELAARVQATREEMTRALAAFRRLPELARQETLARERAAAEEAAVRGRATPEAKLEYLDGLRADAVTVATGMAIAEREMLEELATAEAEAREAEAAARRAEEEARRAEGRRPGRWRRGRRDDGDGAGIEPGPSEQAAVGPGEEAQVVADAGAGVGTASARVGAAREGLARVRAARRLADGRLDRIDRTRADVLAELARLRAAREATLEATRGRRVGAAAGGVEGGGPEQGARAARPAAGGVGESGAAGPEGRPPETGLEAAGGELAALEGELRQARERFAALTRGEAGGEAGGPDGGRADADGSDPRAQRIALQAAAARVGQLEVARAQVSARWGEQAAARAMQRAQARVAIPRLDVESAERGRERVARVDRAAAVGSGAPGTREGIGPADVRVAERRPPAPARGSVGAPAPMSR